MCSTTNVEPTRIVGPVVSSQAMNLTRKQLKASVANIVTVIAIIVVVVILWEPQWAQPFAGNARKALHKSARAH